MLSTRTFDDNLPPKTYIRGIFFHLSSKNTKILCLGLIQAVISRLVLRVVLTRATEPWRRLQATSYGHRPLTRLPHSSRGFDADRGEPWTKFKRSNARANSHGSRTSFHHYKIHPPPAAGACRNSRSFAISRRHGQFRHRLVDPTSQS